MKLQYSLKKSGKYIYFLSTAQPPPLSDLLPYQSFNLLMCIWTDCKCSPAQWLKLKQALWKASCSQVSKLLSICGNRSSTCFSPSHLRSNLCGSYLADSYRWPCIQRLIQMMNEWVNSSLHSLSFCLQMSRAGSYYYTTVSLQSVQQSRTLCSD